MDSTLLEGFDADLELVWPELQRVARPARERRRLNPEILSSLVVDLCERVPLSVRELAALLNRSEAYIGDAIRPMVGDGSLSFLYPDQPKHPGQRYVAGAMAVAVQSAREDDGTVPAVEGEAEVGVLDERGVVEEVEEGVADEGATATEEVGHDRADDISLGTVEAPAEDTSAEEVAATPSPAAPEAPRAADESVLPEADVEDAPALSTVVPPSPPPAPPTARRIPPPSLFEPTRAAAPPPAEEIDALPPRDADAETGSLAEPGERSEEARPYGALEDDVWASTAETRPPPLEPPTRSRILTARQNIAIALAVGLALGLGLPPLIPLWTLGAAVLLALAHVGLDSAQYQAFRHRPQEDAEPLSPPHWIVFFILKVGFTAVEIGFTAFFTSLVRSQF